MPNLERRKSVVRAIVDSFFGDGGKGKLGDKLAELSDLIIKTNGGANAGHSINDVVLHLLPDGILYPDKLNLIGSGVVLDIFALKSEMESLLKIHPELTFDNLKISDRATLLLQYHKIIEKIEEEARAEQKIGTTLRGIGPAYADKTGRNALNAKELINSELFIEHLAEKLEMKKKIYNISKEDQKYFEIDYYVESIREISKYLKNKVVDSHQLINQYLNDNKNILLVAGQGTFLDINHGTYPFVTSSYCTIDGIAASTGIPSTKIDERWGVVKAYATRVGNGPFPTKYEENEKVGKLIRQRCPDGETGASTGRVRDIGRFDAPLNKYAHEKNDFTHINITRLDILSNIDGLEICTHYNGETPVYKKMAPWHQEIIGITEYDKLPKEAKAYCEEIMKSFKNAKLALIGTGPKRQDFIELT